MSRHHRLHALAITFGLFTFLSFALSSEAVGQDVHPGAVPAWGKGDPNAPVMLEVFNDYQCPPCARFNKELKAIEARYKSSVRVVFRNFPLTRIHKNALSAAEAAEAAGLQGKFIEMIDLLYDKSEQWRDSDETGQLFASYALGLGLDVNRFAGDMKGEEVRERIRLDVKRAESLDVKGTPTILINGKEVDVSSYENVHLAIKEALGATKP
jgi:protein-disulfide isomerase